MTSSDYNHGSYPSTTWAWKKVKIDPAPRRQQAQRPKGGRWHLLPWRDRRKPLQVTLKYRGGAECWVEVHARGAQGRFPGYVAIIDILNEICQYSSFPGNPPR